MMNLPINVRPAIQAGKALAKLSLGLALLASTCAQSFAQGVPVVRDAEIEALVRDYSRPIFNAAGLSKAGIQIVLVNDKSFNAFVAGRRMFINTGALMQSETPNEIIGVIAHEAGHLAGGHQQRLRDQLERAKTMAIIASLLGAGAIVAGGASDNRGLAGAGIGLATGGGEVARRSLLSYQRGEEMAADRSAITYLDKTGQSGKGMLRTFQRFQSALSLSGAKVDPYRVSHPMPQDRISNLQTLIEKSPHYGKADSEALQQRHDMARFKIAAYTDGQAAASRMIAKSPGTLAAKYGDAQITYLYGNLRSAQSKAGKPKEAAAAYGKAIQLDKAKSGLLPVMQGQALLAIGTPEAIKQAVGLINKGLERDRENISAYRYLAQAQGLLGNVGEAELATAEGYYYSGGYRDAAIFAARAQTRLKPNSPAWTRAQDIINQGKSARK
jgi:predicted Zn-dependent protease